MHGPLVESALHETYHKGIWAWGFTVKSDMTLGHSWQINLNCGKRKAPPQLFLQKCQYIHNWALERKDRPLIAPRLKPAPFQSILYLRLYLLISPFQGPGPQILDFWVGLPNLRLGLCPHIFMHGELPRISVQQHYYFCKACLFGPARNYQDHDQPLQMHPLQRGLNQLHGRKCVKQCLGPGMG